MRTRFWKCFSASASTAGQSGSFDRCADAIPEPTSASHATTATRPIIDMRFPLARATLRADLAITITETALRSACEEAASAEERKQ